MPRRPKQARKNGHRQEDKTIELIDVLHQCEVDVKELFKLVKAPTFTQSVKEQNKAALIVRGLEIKLTSLDAANKQMEGNLEGFIEQVKFVARQYGQLWNNQSIKLIVAGDEDGGPVRHEVKHGMNLKGLELIIRKDQETR